MKQLLNPNEQPPRCFSFLCPETGVRLPANGVVGLEQVVELARQHYRANGYAVPAGLRERIIEQCCGVTAPDRCREFTPEGNPLPADPTGTSWHRVKNCLQTLLTWAAQYRLQPAPLEEQARRAAICQFCTYNVQETGCSACNNRALQYLLEKLVVRTDQPWDKQLHSCGVCGCKLSAKVRLPLEALQQHTPAPLKEQFNTLTPHCWMNWKP